jgi:PAS domain S-box-containing protein
MLEGPDAVRLRAPAEHAPRSGRAEFDAESSLNHDRFVDELRIHGADLQLQNETLRAVQRKLVMQNDALRVFERELELSHARCWELFDVAPAGYVKLDAAGRVRHANRSAEVLLAAARGRLLERALAEFTDGADLQALQAHLRTASLRQDVCEVRLHRFDGSILHARVLSRPTRDGGCLMVLNDTGERRRIEKALTTANRELEARVLIRTRELAARNAALEKVLRAQVASEAERLEVAARLRDAESLESLGRLAGGIAHDSTISWSGSWPTPICCWSWPRISIRSYRRGW